ncbi:MAG: ATP-binding cassette domain-containing protein, partial [Candidatus Dormiibacterota bacterium]
GGPAPAPSGGAVSVAPVAQATRGMAVQCDRVVLLYPSDEGAVAALRGIDLDISAGEALAVLGPSGSGKSSLLALLAGLVAPSTGQVWLGGRSLGRMSARELTHLRATSISLVLQDPTRNLLPYATALQNVEYAYRLGASESREPTGPAKALLEEMGIAHLERRLVATMSGGEQQRLAIAGALVMGPELLLLDEPTNQLDVESRDQVLAMLLAINRDRGTTVLCVTHDKAVADALPRTVRIRDGMVGSEARQGQNYAVVSRDGTVQLPGDVLDLLAPGSLVRVRRTDRGAELTNSELPGPE